MEPEPFGNRFVPPRLLTAVGQGDAEDQTVALSLYSEKESHEIAASFEQIGWQVLILSDPLEWLEVLSDCSPSLLITDHPEHFAGDTASLRCQVEKADMPEIVAVVDERQSEHLQGLWVRGVHAAMVRTVGKDKNVSYSVIENPL